VSTQCKKIDYYEDFNKPINSFSLNNRIKNAVASDKASIIPKLIIQ